GLVHFALVLEPLISGERACGLLDLAFGLVDDFAHDGQCSIADAFERGRAAACSAKNAENFDRRLRLEVFSRSIAPTVARWIVTNAFRALDGATTRHHPNEHHGDGEDEEHVNE